MQKRINLHTLLERKIYQSIKVSFRDIAKLFQYILYHIISQM
nr:MAG TPA: hypothetical protein [Caudoviricetes sp.]